MADLNIAVVCSSNQNRSMEAHSCLSKKGFNIRSFGTGSQVKLPGPAPNLPNIYDFSTTYDEMYKDLLRKDPELYSFNGMQVLLVHEGKLCGVADDNYGYKTNGILHMLDRNRRIKPRPERFQACKDTFDLIISCEERVYDQIIEELESRERTETHPVHIINIDIQDNHEEATIGAFIIRDLVTTLSECEDLDNEIDEIIQEFEHTVSRSLLHSTWFM